MPAPWRRNLTFAAVAGLYLLLLAAVVGGGLYARSWAISVYGSPQAQSQWDEWRAGTAKLSTQGPVKRRVPQSDKPQLDPGPKSSASADIASCFTVSLHGII